MFDFTTLCGNILLRDVADIALETFASTKTNYLRYVFAFEYRMLIMLGHWAMGLGLQGRGVRIRK